MAKKPGDSEKSSGKRKTFDVGRDAKTGRFITVEEAKRRPATTVVERIPKGGKGDTKKGSGSGGTNDTGPRKR